MALDNLVYNNQHSGKVLHGFYWRTISFPIQKLSVIFLPFHSIEYPYTDYAK